MEKEWESGKIFFPDLLFFGSRCGLVGAENDQAASVGCQSNFLQKGVKIHQGKGGPMDFSVSSSPPMAK